MLVFQLFMDTKILISHNIHTSQNTIIIFLSTSKHKKTFLFCQLYKIKWWTGFGPLGILCAGPCFSVFRISGCGTQSSVPFRVSQIPTCS